MATLGSLVVTLEANIAKFQSDLGKAVTMAEASMNKIARTVGAAQDSLGMLAKGFGMYEIGSFGLDVLKATAELAALSTTTGLTVEALSAISIEAQKAGMTVEEAAISFDRMQRNAASAVGGNRQMTAAFAAVGISAAQLAAGLKDPQALLLLLATNMEKYADDGYKTAEMQLLLGRGGAAMTEMLHGLAEAGYQNANVTADQAQKAKDFETELTNVSVWVKHVALDFMMSFIPAVKIAGTALITSFSDAWIEVKYDFQMSLSWMSTEMRKWAHIAGEVISLFPGIIGMEGQALRGMASPGLDAGKLLAEKTAALAENAAIMKEAADDYVRLTAGPAATAATGAKKPSITPPPHDDLLKGLKGTLDARLKVLDDAIKAEDLAMKGANQLLDRDYSLGIASLAQYSVDKLAILQRDFDTTQALYSEEIALADAYAAKQIDAQLKLQAVAKAQTLRDAKAEDAQKYAQAQITLTDSISTKQVSLAKSVLDTAGAYATMNGNTELANALATDQQDGMLKQILLTNGFGDALKQLTAIEEDRRMRASRDGLDGMMRAVIDYQKGLADVAKATEAMTTKMLGGMEDALVSFVMTGKLNFTSLINSMISDLLRMQMRATVMPWIAKMLGFAIGAMSGDSTAVTYDTSSQMGGMTDSMGHAAGGGYIDVGERGPEKFYPNTSGTVVPSGGGGGGGVVLHYAPVIQIDSRADRMTVQQDAANIMRQGQRELVALLKRYNPGLRT